MPLEHLHENYDLRKLTDRQLITLAGTVGAAFLQAVETEEADEADAAEGSTEQEAQERRSRFGIVPPLSVFTAAAIQWWQRKPWIAAVSATSVSLVAGGTIFAVINTPSWQPPKPEPFRCGAQPSCRPQVHPPPLPQQPEESEPPEPPEPDKPSPPEEPVAVDVPVTMPPPNTSPPDADPPDKPNPPDTEPPPPENPELRRVCTLRLDFPRLTGRLGDKLRDGMICRYIT